MIRLIPLFVCLSLPAQAQVMPGDPPWSCTIAAACMGQACVSLPPGLPSVQIEGSASALTIAGRPAPVYATTGEAKAAVQTGAIPGNAINLLVRDDQGVTDAIAFRLYAPSWQGETGGLTDEHAWLICN